MAVSTERFESTLLALFPSVSSTGRVTRAMMNSTREKLGGGWSNRISNNKVGRGEYAFSPSGDVTALASSETMTAAYAPAPERFSINQRFSFVEKMVKMVAKGITASVLITGEGGIGKSHVVRKSLESNGLVEFSALDGDNIGSKSYVFVKGYSTPKGLYRTLYENNNRTIVFDDCDSVLRDPVALNLLKGALDSYDVRVISWNSDMRDDDLPRSFRFDGRVVFISNLPLSKIDQAIRSRSMPVDLTMSLDQKIERMETILTEDDFLPEFDLAVKRDALALIKEFKTRAREISLRTLIAVSKARATDSDWKDLGEYILCGG